MIEKINKPSQLTKWIARSSDGSVLHVGETASNQVTVTGLDVLDGYDDVNEYLSGVSTWADKFPDLPSSGEVSEGDYYNHGGNVVIVRQTHERTADNPSDVPALFLVAREPGTDIEWIAGESVAVGTVRTYEGTKYKAIQAHITQSDWTPPSTPALWSVMSDSKEWAAGISVTVDEEYTYKGTLYRVLQSHTTQVGWEPPNTPALWSSPV